MLEFISPTLFPACALCNFILQDLSFKRFTELTFTAYFLNSFKITGYTAMFIISTIDTIDGCTRIKTAWDFVFLPNRTYRGPDIKSANYSGISRIKLNRPSHTNHRFQTKTAHVPQENSNSTSHKKKKPPPTRTSPHCSFVSLYFHPLLSTSAAPRTFLTASLRQSCALQQHGCSSPAAQETHPRGLVLHPPPPFHSSSVVSLFIHMHVGESMTHRARPQACVYEWVR